AKKQKSVRRLPAPLHIDPGQLQLSEGSFITKTGGPLKQLSFDEVQAQASGICFCTVEQAGPFLALGRNLSVDALALATTAELPDSLALQVSSVRYPAVFTPTQEAILVSGSLIQLGDEEVQLCATDIAEVEHLSTAVCRLNLFRDEYKHSWEKFCEAPLRVLLQQVPEFQVCKDPTCGGKCSGFHAAVDEVVEHLFLDVWARQWVRLAGGKAKPAEAELFQAFLRLPASALPHVFSTSLDGLYLEPRAADGTGPHAAWAVVWLPGQTGAQAQLAMRTTEKALAVTRLGHKFGLRTKEADEQAVFEMLRPQHIFLKVRVTARFRLHPLPHGFQRHNLVQLLKQWEWNCKPLQPDRGDSVGCAWIVGASCDPPALALPLGQGFVLATKIRDVGQPRVPSKEVCASVRTRRALLVDDDPDVPADPWADGSDPWSAARPVPQAASSSTEAVTKIAQLEAGLKHDLQDIVQRKLDERDAAGPPPGLSDQDKRLHALETTVTEMRHQGAKFETWFQGFGTKVSDQATQLEALKTTVQEQQIELGKVRTDLQTTVQSAVASLQGNLTNQMAAQLAGQMEQIQSLFAALHTVPTVRFGEADHPGPAANFFVSTSNPSGLRSKEPFYSDWGFGVHCFSETQLSAVSLPACRRQFQACAKAVNRHARVTSGAPAALRVNSDWAGSWTGVLQVGDLPCSTFNVDWPPGLFETGRVMISRHFHDSLSVMIATVYGYPQGPTWPDALHRTDTLLGTLTREVVLGSKGFRVICGDFNHDTSSLHQCQIWKTHGWVEAQDLAHQFWGIPPQPTCKNATQRDFIWLSPEAASYCVQVRLLSVALMGMSLRSLAGIFRPTVSDVALAPSPNVQLVSLALCAPAVLAKILCVTTTLVLKSDVGFSSCADFSLWRMPHDLSIRPLLLLITVLDFGVPSAMHVDSAVVPLTVPDATSARLIYEDFRGNFRRLESWYLHNRAKVLDAKYDHSLAQLYQELRDPAPEQVDTLQVTRDYAILATDTPGAQLHVERPLDLRGHSTWAVDGVPVALQTAEADVCTLACDVSESGQELEQVQTLSSVPDLHDEFVSLWAPRWQQHANASPSDWQRFLDFAAAYLPSHQFDLPDIDVPTWNKALRRFRPRAARGPDGWARDDLLHLPPARTAELLRFLRSLELEGKPWPKQLVVGFVCLLYKGNGRLDANGYRPICLFSIVYRTWAGIRARQVLLALRSIVPDGLFGFVPGREATELWYSVQLEVELSVLGGTRLLGLSTDVVKAFNSLPRVPLLTLAAQLGCPRRLLDPWCSFLEVNERRFMIRQQVSSAVTSTSGFPEGCPLSPVAMVFADWAYHAYLQLPLFCTPTIWSGALWICCGYSSMLPRLLYGQQLQRTVASWQPQG
ncbi:Pol, partial [Symbiodinium necroappetens]